MTTYAIRPAFRMLIPAVLILSSTGFAHANDDHIRSFSLSSRIESTSQLPPALVGNTFQQPIDHSGLLPGQTFAQRYWTDSEYATQPDTAPILYHICGEGDATQGYFLNDNAIEWAQALGAHLVYLEHRYYGQSQPFADISTDHLQYLTLNNVIEDLATFQKWIAQQNGWKGKWISLGGSYSGTLSALYRQAHPELVVGALAASAPMISGIGQQEGTQDDVDQLSSTSYADDTGDRQWTYEACTTFGFWVAEGATPGSTLDLPSSFLCGQIFAGAPMYNSTAYNQSYNAPFIANAPTAPSNILFTYGTDDIWTTIGLSTQTNANTAITIWTIDGAGHHFDLNAPTSSDSAAVVAARGEFLTLAKQWLGQ